MIGLPDTQTFVHGIDAEDRIAHVNDAWLTFARENAYENAGGGVLGQPLWSFIADVATQALYEVVLEKVRNDAIAISLPYRCDSPSLRRFMRLDMVPRFDYGVDFCSRVIRLESRPEPLLLTAEDRSDEFIRMCSWCKRVATPNNTWVEVETAIELLGLFDEPRLPGITHGVCPECQERVLKALEA